MDGGMDEDSQPTQATQTIVDPRRLGKQNSGFSDEDIADIICILYPQSENARLGLAALAMENSKHMVETLEGEGTSMNRFLEDDPSKFRLATAVSGAHAIVLRLSAVTKDPTAGFTFGRHPTRCDFCFHDDPLKRLSNIHCRIFINEYGVLMLEDTSTNGTIVDDVLLKKNNRQGRHETMRTLSNGSVISILLHEDSKDLKFLVHVPRRHGEYDAAFRRNLLMYRRGIQLLEEEQGQTPTMVPGPGGHVDLFPKHFRVPEQPRRPRLPSPGHETTQSFQQIDQKLPREWNGSADYNRVGQIGKGAFAVVHKVTSKFDGRPYAAKELDKRRFMKNGVLDQKVDNEMKIMRSIAHPNIVRYIDHFDWDSRLLIIIMEYVPMGDLTSYVHRLKALPEHMAISMVKQLTSALGYLHENNITHRDVKPDNILIDSVDPFTVKLTDFGLSKMIDNEETFLRTFCGTLLYCAPEVYSEYADYDQSGRRQARRHHRRAPEGQRYDHAVDIWSLGGVLYYSLAGSPPFPAKSGTSYSELLHDIMTKPLNIDPLRAMRLSSKGIDCLSWMLHRRPENRATVEDIQNHPWLGGSGQMSGYIRSSDEDEGLGMQASQLSLEDHNPQRWAPQSDDEIIDEEDEEDMDVDELHPGSSNDTWSQKENHTFGRPGQPRLFGEVNVSAIGSSGVIPADRLNLPVADSPTLRSTEINDSFEPEPPSAQHLGPRPQYRIPGGLGGLVERNKAAAEANGNTGNLPRNLSTVRNSGESLGDAGSILQTLNVKSLTGSHRFLSEADFTSSKRKPPPSSYETSDEMDNLSSTAIRKPTFKRLRSEGNLELLDTQAGDDHSTGSGYGGYGGYGRDSADDGDYGLIASVPPISRMTSNRQMDNPVSKTAFWVANDRKTWHLTYPEMTQLQHDAFRAAAEARGEEFSPGRSPLWDLAMVHFPPTSGSSPSSSSPVDERDGESSHLLSTAAGALTSEAGGGGAAGAAAATTTTGATTAATTATSPIFSVAGAGPSPSAGLVVPVSSGLPDQRRIVASLLSDTASVVQGLSVLVREAFTSFGRADDNTQVYTPRTEVKVPKYAFKLLLWRAAGGFEPWRNFRPWDAARDSGGFHFYASTKATNGVRVNDLALPSHEPRSPAGPSRRWVRLHDGDVVVIWGQERQQVRLRFQCAWGGSSVARQQQQQHQQHQQQGRGVMAGVAAATVTATTFVPDEVAARLDDACARCEKRFPQLMEDDRLNAAAAREYGRRLRRVEVERQRSRAFEAKRMEACRALGVVVAGGGGREGAVSAPPPTTRTTPTPGPPPPPGRRVSGSPEFVERASGPPTTYARSRGFGVVG